MVEENGDVEGFNKREAGVSVLTMILLLTSLMMMRKICQALK